ncbi:unnamed protein product [Cyprideis torosa]|uniref:Uncharacterized protein n=1 Tax=Cyprideis torosa TaxID=163714 RepID=A0A7R8WGU3_9CRUS|nr:unnamed protein product [Cyprideis torosa]CAG0892138.1 unnamed protein product [Cyprideis torosa]
MGSECKSLTLDSQWELPMGRPMGLPTGRPLGLPTDCSSRGRPSARSNGSSSLLLDGGDVLSSTPPSDWRGIAECMGVSPETRHHWELINDPVRQLLDEWPSIAPDNATVADLIERLQDIDRFDIIDDLKSYFENDLKRWVSSEESSYLSTASGLVTSLGSRREFNAFLLFADEDREFGYEVRRYLEDEKKLTLFLLERDLVGGIRRMEEVASDVMTRCYKFIPVLSPAYFTGNGSVERRHYIARAEQIANVGAGVSTRKRYIIPILYRSWPELTKQIPQSLQCLHLLDYEKAMKGGWDFWEKLAYSVKRVDRKSESTRKKPNGVMPSTQSLSFPSALSNLSTVPIRDFPSEQTLGEVPPAERQSDNSFTSNNSFTSSNSSPDSKNKSSLAKMLKKIRIPTSRKKSKSHSSSSTHESHI